MDRSSFSGNESDSSASISKESIDQTWKPSRDFLLAFGSLCMLSIAVSMDATSLSVALAKISQDIDGTALQAFWSGTSFLLSSTVLQPTLASLSGIFGRKYMLYVSVSLFAAGSLLCALAGNFTVLIAGRTIQGVGGGGLIALTEVVITDLVPLQFRGNWLSMLSAFWALGTVSGPLMGAGFAQHISWRWIFYINLPLIGLGLGMIVFFLHQNGVPGGMREKLGRIDYIGAALFTAAMTSCLFGITTGGVMYPWTSFRCLLPLIIGFIGLFVFAWYERDIAKEPIIERAIFNNRDMILTYAMTAFHGAILWALLYFMVLYFEAVKFMSPISSALGLLPLTLTVAPAAMLVGAVANVIGRYRWSLWTGWTLAVVGCGLLSLLKPSTSTAAWIFINVPAGFGLGMLFTSMALSVQASSRPELNGPATAFFVFLRGLGQALGVSISGVIFQNVFKTEMQKFPAFAAIADEYSRDATVVVSIIKGMPESQDRTDLVHAYNQGLKMIWVALLAWSAAAGFLSIFIKGHTLLQKHVTAQALAKREVLSDSELENASSKE